MMLVIEETDKILGQQSLIKDGDGNHFLVSSVNNGVANKTFIVKCDHNMKVKDWNDCYVIIPANHKEVMKSLLNGILKPEQFNFKSEF